MKPADRTHSPRRSRARQPDALFSLRDQVALVTGGSMGLGFEIARTLSAAGATVALLARDSRTCSRAAVKIQRETGARCVALHADVADPERTRSAIASLEQSAGAIDILVNSAGINIRGPIEDVSAADFARVQEVNVTGTWLCCQAVVPGMKRRGYGRIVNIGSALSLCGLPGRTPYATSKGAVLNLTRCLAVELAQSGITVNAVLPGFFATDLNVALMKKPAVMRTLTARIPMGRWGELHEIGAVALFLASPAATYVTGAAIPVDGGWTAS